jgi:hypothetical protein
VSLAELPCVALQHEGSSRKARCTCGGCRARLAVHLRCELRNPLRLYALRQQRQARVSRCGCIASGSALPLRACRAQTDAALASSQPTSSRRSSSTIRATILPRATRAVVWCCSSGMSL